MGKIPENISHVLLRAGWITTRKQCHQEVAGPSTLFNTYFVFWDLPKYITHEEIHSIYLTEDMIQLLELLGEVLGVM
jgi:hypothetical protein